MDNSAPLPSLKLPKPFAAVWPQIEATQMGTIKITASPKKELRLDASKFGGNPWLPADHSYPRDEKGEYMYLLAQINFREMPALAGYPTSGILQFYITHDPAYAEWFKKPHDALSLEELPDFNLYGLDLDNRQLQADFRILYFEDTSAPSFMDFSFLPADFSNGVVMPVGRQYALQFEQAEDFIGLHDYRYTEKQVPDLEAIIEKNGGQRDHLVDFMLEHFMSSGHKIGGYACFTQQDIRASGHPYEGYLLLLQIDSENGIMWGDHGVGNFFIHPDDLARKDFSKVVYNWDC